MSQMLTAAEADEVERFFQANTTWAMASIAKWNLRPSGYDQHVARQKERWIALRAAASARRVAAKLNRTPPWADMDAISAVYEAARKLSAETGIEHHVDHKIPLQGRLVSGLHVANNLQILTGSDNCRKGNRFEVET